MDDFDDIIDLSKFLDPFDLPLCPFCDQEIQIDGRPISIAKAHDTPFFCHLYCLAYFRKEKGI